MTRRLVLALVGFGLVALAFAPLLGFRIRFPMGGLLLVLFGYRAVERVLPGRPAPRRKPGVWADPPVAELDKSTFGLLLASRLRRVPGLRVAPPRPRADPPRPDPADRLWDRELDG